MTPQERQLIDRLFDRLATLETAPRDPDAVRAINDGLSRAPHGLYPLVQTVLVQEEALKRADERIRAMEAELGGGGSAQQPGGFLDQMRDTFLGRREQPGSVPSVGAGGTPWSGGARQPMGMPSSGQGQPWAGAQRQPEQGGGGAGGSFLGTAAATAAGVLGGALLMNSMKGLFGGEQAKAQSAFDQPGGGSPWDQNSGGGLASEAGLGDIGRSGDRAAASSDGGESRFGLFDTAQNDADDGGYNDGGDFGGDSDLA